MPDLVEFNAKILMQAHALQNAGLFQPGQKLEHFKFDLHNSSKNYLFVPLRLTSDEFAYEIDVETIDSFTERCLEKHTIRRLHESG